MLSLLALSVLLTGGALFVKYKLELLRGSVQREAQNRTGAQLELGSVEVRGLRGLRIRDLHMTYRTPSGVTADVAAPIAAVDIDIVDLLHGTVSIERVFLGSPSIRVARPENAQWLAEGGLAAATESGVLGKEAFRVEGSNGTIEIANIVGDTRLSFGQLAFDVFRLAGVGDIAAKVSGNLNGDTGKNVRVDLRFSSLDDFDFRLACDRVDAQDVNVLFPASRQLVTSGVFVPGIRVAGYPAGNLVVSCEASFSDLSIRGQPEFLGPVTGQATALARYDMQTRELSLATAKASSDELAGSVEGTISFAENTPGFDLRLEATEFPVRALLDSVLAHRADDYAAMELQLDAPYKVEAFLKGTSEAPLIRAQMNVTGGTLRFDPVSSGLPAGELGLGPISVAWDSETAATEGSAAVESGTLDTGLPGLRAERLSGMFRLKEGKVTCDPLNMVITGNPFVGSLVYDTSKTTFEMNLDGAIARMEDTMLGSAIKDLTLAGSASVRGHLTAAKGRAVIEGAFDATQAQVDFEWWLRKPAGVGAAGKAVRIEIKPGRTITIEGNIEVSSTPIAFSSEVVYSDGKWRHKSLHCSTGHADITSAARCIRIPYTIVGGAGTNCEFSWERSGDGGARMTIGGAIDEISLLPEGSDIPLRMSGVRTTVTTLKGERRTGVVQLDVADGHMPPFGAVWFLPLNTDPDMRERYPDTGRTWTYDLSAAKLELPPWKGTDFEGDAWSDEESSGLKRFAANIVGGGRLDGGYKNRRQENIYNLDVQWQQIPASYLIAHLKLPGVLEGGTSTGKVHYTVDRDDPATLEGTGTFEVSSSQFSADFILSRFDTQLRNDVSALPPSLKFSSLSADVALHGDTVDTPRIALLAEGVSINGAGKFIRDGDMDYDIQVSLTPETAARIPLLRDALNLEGHRLAQQQIDLAFRVTGPTFNPQGQLAQAPPLGVTLVSGAMEVTSEAVKMIDLPRRLLVDLLKTAGGVVASRKP